MLLLQDRPLEVIGIDKLGTNMFTVDVASVICEGTIIRMITQSNLKPQCHMALQYGVYIVALAALLLYCATRL